MVALLTTFTLLLASISAASASNGVSVTVSRVGTLTWSTTDATGKPGYIEHRPLCQKYGAKVRLRVVNTRRVSGIVPQSKLTVAIGDTDGDGVTYRRVAAVRKGRKLEYSFNLRPGAYIRESHVSVAFRQKGYYAWPRQMRREICFTS